LHKFSLAIVRFKNYFPAYRGIEIEHNIRMLFRELIEDIPVPHKSCPAHHQFYPLLGHEHSEQ
jgi:hypothetical protein